MRPRRPILGRVFAALIAFAASACGYESVHSAGALRRGPYALTATSIHVADPEAALAVEAGARTELARQGALAQCEPARNADCASIVVELLRLDEATSGIAAVAGAPQGLGVRTTARGRVTIFDRGTTESIDDVEDERVRRDSAERSRGPGELG